MAENLRNNKKLLDLPIPKFLETYTPTPLVKFLIKK